jgi:hypothetical protein
VVSVVYEAKTRSQYLRESVATRTLTPDAILALFPIKPQHWDPGLTVGSILVCEGDNSVINQFVNGGCRLRFGVFDLDENLLALQDLLQTGEFLKGLTEDV